MCVAGLYEWKIYVMSVVITVCCLRELFCMIKVIARSTKTHPEFT